MALTLEWTIPDPTADLAFAVLDFDAIVSEGHELASEVSDHNVEDGAAISDHVRAQGKTITLEAVVTDSPLFTMLFGMDGAQISVQPLALPDGTNASIAQPTQPVQRVKRVDEQLQALQDDATLLTVRTTLRVLDDVVIVRYKVERSPETGNSVNIALELRRVRIVTTQRTTVAIPAQRRGQRAQNRGSQETTPVDNRSAIARGLDTGLGRQLAGLFGQ